MKCKVPSLNHAAICKGPFGKDDGLRVLSYSLQGERIPMNDVMLQNILNCRPTGVFFFQGIQSCVGSIKDVKK